jgi:hypothetical protein
MSRTHQCHENVSQVCHHDYNNDEFINSSVLLAIMIIIAIIIIQLSIQA